jgi:hypothetical protein
MCQNDVNLVDKDNTHQGPRRRLLRSLEGDFNYNGGIFDEPTSTREMRLEVTRTVSNVDPLLNGAQSWSKRDILYV